MLSCRDNRLAESEAAKAAIGAPGTVTVNATRTPDGSTYVLVRDTGIGMTEEELRIALTPFGQVDGSRARWREGTGLGLPIAKALVELHGGHIDIVSTKNEGTSVAVMLPPRHLVSIHQGRDAVLGQGQAF